MKSFLTIICFLLISTAIFSQNADAVLGKWTNKNQDKTIEIYKSNDLYYGKLVHIKDSEKGIGTTRLDLENPNKSLESRSLLGIDYLISFSYFTEKDVWKEGHIYNFESGNTYTGKMSMNDEGELELTGYYGILWFLGRTKKFTRVAE